MILHGSNRNTKIMFHKLNEKEIENNPHYNLDNFEEFQKEHWNKFFKNTKYILSFWYEGKIAEFIGSYRLGEPKISDVIDPKSGKERVCYKFPHMKKTNFLEEYKNRLFINWTNPSANYGRWLEDDKYEIHSIKSKKEYSIGLLPRNSYEIKLHYSQLEHIFEYPIDNQDWKDYLSNRSGVYLILDRSSGEQYIGSAYGDHGIWGRWNTYASNGHGGNLDLKNLDPQNFQFSILWETLKATPKENIIRVESQFKENLGTRVHGLNNN